jgi:hypothetical protein
MKVCGESCGCKTESECQFSNIKVESVMTLQNKREIKFRAWHTEANKMLFIGDDSGTTHPLDCAVYAKNQPVILMQYTGRTDITPPWEDSPRPGSKQLYEGDIVKAWVSRYPDSKTTGWIEYNEHAQAFQLRYENCFNGHANEFLHRYHFFEVIGNIYEHPDLLKP